MRLSEKLFHDVKRPQLRKARYVKPVKIKYNIGTAIALFPIHFEEMHILIRHAHEAVHLFCVSRCEAIGMRWAHRREVSITQVEPTTVVKVVQIRKEANEH